MARHLGTLIYSAAISTFLSTISCIAEPQPGNCSGILHSVQGRLMFGGGKGDESICIIEKSAESMVLSVCSIGRRCTTTGVVDYCKDSGECAEISNITSVQKR